MVQEVTAIRKYHFHHLNGPNNQLNGRMPDLTFDLIIQKMRDAKADLPGAATEKALFNRTVELIEIHQTRSTNGHA